jgi:hypothetical protein
VLRTTLTNTHASIKRKITYLSNLFSTGCLINAFAISTEYATVSMTRVSTQTHIGGDQQLGAVRRLQRAHSDGTRTAVTQSTCAAAILCRCVLNNDAKHDHTLQAKCDVRSDVVHNLSCWNMIYECLQLNKMSPSMQPLTHSDKRADCSRCVVVYIDANSTHHASTTTVDTTITCHKDWKHKICSCNSTCVFCRTRFHLVSKTRTNLATLDSMHD